MRHTKEINIVNIYGNAYLSKSTETPERDDSILAKYG